MVNSVTLCLFLLWQLVIGRIEKHQHYRQPRLCDMQNVASSFVKVPSKHQRSSILYTCLAVNAFWTLLHGQFISIDLRRISQLCTSPLALIRDTDRLHVAAGVSSQFRYRSPLCLRPTRSYWACGSGMRPTTSSSTLMRPWTLLPSTPRSTSLTASCQTRYTADCKDQISCLWRLTLASLAQSSAASTFLLVHCAPRSDYALWSITSFPTCR